MTNRFKDNFKNATLAVEKCSYDEKVAIWFEENRYTTIHVSPEKAVEIATAILNTVGECK